MGQNKRYFLPFDFMKLKMQELDERDVRQMENMNDDIKPNI